MSAPATRTSRGHSTEETATKRRWRTPAALFGTMQREFGLDFDATAEDGRLCASHITPAQDALVIDWRRFGRRGWLNSPWGPPHTRCPANCTRDHKRHFAADFAGTAAFVARAIDQVRWLEVVVMLLPTAPDTAHWRAAFRASVEVRLLPRVAFLDGDTLEEMTQPPGAGC